MVISDYNQFGARSSETGALKHALAHVGVVAPHTGESYSDALLFGIGGGIGFAYFLFEKSGTHPIHLGTRIHTKETERPEFAQTILNRIAAPAHVQNSSSATAAAANLKRNLVQGQAPVVWVDPSRLAYLGMNGAVNSYYSVVVFGMDDDSDTVTLADRCPGAVTVTSGELQAARETSWSPKYRSLLVQKAEGEPDLRDAVDQGIRDCLRQIYEGLGITNFGLRGLEKWATVLTSTKEKKSWIKIFPPGPALYDALYSMFVQISARGGGAANRGLYADFLTEAAEILNRPTLREAAEQYRRAERIWTELGEAHLPEAVPEFAEARQLTLRRNRLFEEKGAEAKEEVLEVRKRLDEIAERCRQTFPLNFNDTRALLADVRARILNVHDSEAEAARALEAAMS
jgi:hypothetical protein